MIDYEFLKILRGKDDMHLIVPEPQKIQQVKQKIALVNEEFKNNRPRIIPVLEQNLNFNIDNIFNKKKIFSKQKNNKSRENKNKINKTLIKSLPQVISSEPCPKGYIRSTRTGKCVKDKKYKLKKAQKVNIDNSILKILREIKK